MGLSQTVSVVIPTHNRHCGLMAALESVFSQDVLPKEIVVVDDGSEPPVPHSIFRHAPSEVDCILERFDKPQGANNARNRGITIASGLYIAFLDDDDMFHAAKLSSITAAIAANPDVDVIYHPAIIRMPTESIEYVSIIKPFASRESIFSELLVMNRVGGTSMVVCRKDSLVAVGMFKQNQPALQDYELWLRLARSGADFMLLEQPLTYYYQMTNRASISKSLASNQRAIQAIEEMYSKEYSAMPKSDRRVHEVWKQRMLVHKALLNGKTFLAIKEQTKAFAVLPSLSNLMSLFAIFLGPTFVFHLKSRFSK